MTSLAYPGMRERAGHRLSRMIFLSLFVHLSLLSAAVFLPLRSSPPRFTLGPVYSVNLVSLSESMLHRQPARDSLPNIAGAAMPAGTQVIKKAVKMEAPPIKKIETKQDLRNPAVEKLRKRLGEKTPEQTASPSVAAATATGGEINDRLADYYRVVWSRIKGQWALPGGINPRDNVEAVVNIRILRNGTIAGVTFEKRSGLAYFDNSVLRALKKAHPLPPLPDWYRDSGLDIGIRFLASDLR
ncbi:MAG TPA: energy transducer TonB [Syntrophales bacterium]|jgi:TonB family protein|nr:energy transducer TonB [Syntrophales bacterium]HON22791.1 energy transducer TonB [Syntrophales bacterium]HOU76784.1 energy transducer TonB [Syntrophales bacterium]HPC31907.1 energy transducer TonB [Syntrophales bacterium]HQG33569.1 energy transducer TonB [Syntrophales bacterium]